MKKVLTVLMVGLFAFAGQAQSNEMELFQSMFNLEKKAALADYLQLSDEEGKVFWGIYEEYAMERKEIMKQSFEIIKEYAEVFENISDEQAQALMERNLKNRMDLEKLHQKYFKKISKAMGGTRGAQFAMFEAFVDTQIRSELFANIPFIEKQ